MGNNVSMAAAFILLLAFLVGGVVLAVSNFNECRNHGFSFLYCVTRK